MKIGLLSICTMMFMLYGTDCRAEEYRGDVNSLQEVKGETFSPVFAKSKKNARRNEQRKKRHASEDSIASVSDAEETQQDTGSMRDDTKNRRSYADVVKGVKKQSEDIQKEPVESEQFYDAVDPEYNDWVQSRRESSVGAEQYKDKEVADFENQNGSDTAQNSEKRRNNVRPSQANRSKKAYEDHVRRIKQAYEARRAK